MSKRRKFDWPELPCHRAILESADADVEYRIIASRQIHTGIMHGIGGSDRNARAPENLASELTKELCSILEKEAPGLLVREVVWQISHILHEGTDLKFSPPDEDNRSLSMTVEKHLQHERIRERIRRCVLKTLQEASGREFGSSLTHARTMSRAIGVELTSEQNQELDVAEIRYWEDRRTRHLTEHEQSIFDDQLREHGQVPVSYLMDRIRDYNLVSIDNSSKGTVLRGLSFLAGIAGPLAAAGLERIAVPIPYTMQERLSSATRRNDAKALEKMLLEGEYALYMLREYAGNISLASYSKDLLEALQSIDKHLQIVCVGADLRLEQGGGNALDQQVSRLASMLGKDKSVLYFACVPFACTSFPLSRTHLTGTHASWPCTTHISLPVMTLRALQGQRACSAFSIQLAEAWHFDESLSEQIRETCEEVFSRVALGNSAPRIRKPPYRIRKSVGVDVNKTLLAKKKLPNFQEDFGEAYNGIIILTDNDYDRDREQKHIYADLPGKELGMEEERSSRKGILLEV